MRNLISLTVLLASIVPGLRAQAPTTARAQSMLTGGDSIRITVWRRPELSGDFVVAPDGSVTHPLYRTVKVGGVALPAAEANVRTFLLKFDQDPQFVMEPLFRVAVTGEVNRPQLFAVNPQTSIAEAVARAGGTTQNARRNRVRLLRTDARGQQSELLVDLVNPEQGLASTPVHSGDQIVVDRSKSFFKDFLIPALTIVGSVASVGLLIERASRP
jgi:polysaccharide export outer membrane protein